MNKKYLIITFFSLFLISNISAQVSSNFEQVISLTQNKVDLTSSATINDVVYFLGSDDASGAELWRTDGTKAGTKLFKDIFTGINSSFASNFGNFGNNIFFHANTSTNLQIFSLFTSNGSLDGTFQIKNFTNPEDQIVYDNKIFCQAKVNGNYFVYLIDGKSENAQVVSDKLEQFYIDDSYFADKILTYKMFEQNGKLFLKQNTKLLVYDKTQGKFITYLKYSEINNQKNPSISIPTKDFVYLGYQISSSQFELFSYKLTDKKISKLAVLITEEGYMKRFNPLIYENTIFFSANNNSSGYEPWVSDGTLDGTKMVSDIDLGPGSSFKNEGYYLIGDKIMFQASEKQNVKDYIYTYDITNKKLDKVKDQEGKPLGSFFGIIYVNKTIAVVDNKVIFGAYRYTNDPEKNDPNYFNRDYIDNNYEYGTFIYNSQNNKLEILKKADAASTIPLVGYYSHIIKENRIYDIGESQKNVGAFSQFRPGAIIPSFEINSKETRSDYFFPYYGSTSTNQIYFPNANFEGSLIITGATFLNNNAFVTLKDIPGLFMSKKCNTQVKITSNVFETCKGSPLTLTTENNSPIWYFKGFPISKEKTFNKIFDESGWLFLEGSDNIGCRTIEKKFITVSKDEINADLVGNTGFCTKENVDLKVVTNSPENIKGYQWFFDSLPLVNETKETLTAKKSGLYSVSITGKNGCSILKSTSVVLLVNSSSVTISKSGETNILTGGSVTLSVPTVSGQTYQWLKDGEIISGAVNNNYKAFEAGTFSVIVTNSGCVKISDQIQVNLILANELEIIHNNLNAYPNPFESLLNVKMVNTDKKESRLFLINSSGAVIKELIIKDRETVFNLIDIPNGIYLLQTNLDDRKSSVKLLKNN